MKTCPVCRRSWADDFRVCPIDGLPLQEGGAAPGADPYIGRTVGNCRIVEKLADGDLGAVYKAEDPVRGAVALQMVSKDRIGSPVLLEAFAGAVQLAAQLNHPRVVRVYGMETGADGTPAVSMEFVPGMTLQKYRQDHPGITPPEACSLVRQAAEGLMAAHRLSILHGAIHPARIFVLPDGSVKVAGFHRGGLREGSDVFTATPATMPYLAPEQVGVVRDVPAPDYRTDLYALGVILYELLAGRLPYEARSVQDLAAIMEGAPPLPPNFANPHVSPLLSRVVMRALSKHPSERQGSVEEFMRELDAASRPAREPQAPMAPRYEPQYPPKGQDSGLFAPLPAAQDSELFAPAPAMPRKESIDNLWPEAPQEKGSSGEGSVFNWFKTRVGSRGGSARPTPQRADIGDDTFQGRSPARRGGDDLEERTVVVSGGDRKRSGFKDTFAGPSRRDMDMTGTGALPRRRFSSKFYLILGIAAVLLVSIISVLLFLSTTSSTGKFMVDSTPPGAQVYINEEYRGTTPLPYLKLKAGPYRVRVQADGFETKVDSVDIATDADVQRTYVLVRQASLTAPAVAPPVEPVREIPLPTPASPPVKLPPFAGMISAALRARNFFPPAADNAFDILQRWQQTPGEEGSQGLEQARQSFCRELEALCREKLDQKDFTGARTLLDQLRSHSPSATCASGMQAAYEKAVGSSLGDLRISARAAMDRQNYITPDSDNALRYVRLMLTIDPRDNEARTLDTEILNRSLDQAKAKNGARQHQDALDIYIQIKEHYPNAPLGAAALDQNIERERGKLNFLKAMMAPFNVQVRHDHGRKYILFGQRECSGILRIDGFGMKYTSTGEHSFQIAYDGLKSAIVEKNKITLQGLGIPDGKIELEGADSAANQAFAQLSAKIAEYRRLYADYMK
jgi:serine/threonine protein kinase